MERNHHIGFVNLISEIAADLVDVDPGQGSDSINHALAAIGCFSNVDRVHVFVFSPDQTTMRNTHEWCGDGIASQREQLQNIPVTGLPWFMEKMRQFEVLNLSHICELPPEAHAERAHFTRQSILSLLALPLVYKGRLEGFLGFDSVHQDRVWQREDVETLGLLGNMLISAIKREAAEAALRASEHKYRMLMENSVDRIWQMDMNLVISYMNPTRIPDIAYAAEEVVGRSLADFISAEDFAQCRKLLMLEADKGPDQQTGVRVELDSITKMGNRERIEVRAVVLFDEQGNPTGIQGLTRDITERRRMEEALRESEARFRMFAELAPVAVVISDHDENTLYVSPKFVELFGYTLEDMPSVQDWWPLAYPDESLRARVSHEWRKAMEEARNQKVEIKPLCFPVTCKNGKERWIEFRGAIMDDLNVIVMLDVTENKRAEREREHALAILETSIAQSPSGILIADASDGVIRWANQAALDIRGQADLPVSGVKVGRYSSRWQAFRPDDAPYAPEELPLSRAILKGEVVRNEEVVIQDDSGDKRWLITNAAPVRDHDGVITAGIVVFHDITEQKQTEQALKLQALVLEQIADRVTITDLNGVITYVNQAEIESLGYTREELIGKSTEKYGENKQQGATQRQILEETLQEGQWRGEVVNKTAAGDEIILDCRTQMVRDAGGKAIALCGIATDITERKKMEHALREGEERFRHLVEDAPFGLSLMRPDRRFVFFNRQFMSIFGYTIDDLPDKDTWFRLAYPDPDYRKTVIDIWTDDLFLKGKVGEPKNREFKVRCKDGSDKIIHFRSVVLADSSEILSYEDITERRKTEAERERLALAIEQASEVFVITEPNGAIQYVNPAFTQVTGYTREEAIGRNPRMLKSGEHDNAFYGEMWSTLMRGETWSGRIINKKKDGTRYIEEVVISPVRDASGATMNYVAVERDITGEMQLEEQLRQAQKMESIGRLAGGVAHDFNNMLGAILGYTELALEKVKPNAPIRADLEEIRKAAERSANLTRQLLAFARKQTIAPKVLDLNATIEGMLKMLRRLIGENIHLAWHPGADLWPVKMDPSQIDQILANLCVNARDAINGSGTLEIKTQNVIVTEGRDGDNESKAPGAYVLITVSDTGCGMDQEGLSHLFEPFYTTKGVGEGTGLGLATIYGMVKQNHGFIDAESQPGQGTTFRVYLPRQDARGESLPIHEPEQSSVSGNETILLVEDEPAILKVTGRILERHGYTILAANSPGLAIQMAERHEGDIHLLVTDVVMPEMNGLDMAGKLVSLYPNLRLLFMSGHTADIIAHEGMLDEGMHFIQKPFRMKDLAVKVRKALDER